MYNPVEISRIDRQIEELQRLKNSYQAMSPQPINNIINTPMQPPSIFEARFTTENPSDVYIQNKTAFIDLKNGKLSIKDVDGTIKEYFIILPKDEKDIKIESLETKLKDMEARLNEYTKFNGSIINEPKSIDNGDEHVTKPKSKNNVLKSSE